MLYKRCHVCKGKGYNPPKWGENCPYCEGQGLIKVNDKKTKA